MDAINKLGEATRALSQIANTAGTALKQGNALLKMFSTEELENKQDFSYDDIKPKQKKKAVKKDG